MEGVVERGTGEGRADSRLHDRRQDRHGGEARRTAATRRPTTTRRSSASCRRAIRRSTIIVVIDSPHGPNGYYGGTVSAPIFKRIAEAALRYLGVGPTINPRAAGARRAARRRRRRASGADATRRRRSSASSPTRPPGTVPDLRGLSARDAVRKLVQARPDRAHDRRRLRRVAGSGGRRAARGRRASAA